MALLAWSNIFSVGVKDIDDQHKKLIELANALNDAIQSGNGRDAVGNILSELVAYTVTHFAFEERLMDQYQYPMSPQHRQEHQGLAKRVGEFQAKFERDDPALTEDVMTFLRDWLSKHIMNSDRMLGKDLNGKGVH